MKPDLMIFSSVEFDGKIHVRYIGVKAFKHIQYHLQRAGKTVAQIDSLTKDETLSFDNQPAGTYKATCRLTLDDGTLATGESMEINISPISQPYPVAPAVNQRPSKSLKGGHWLYEGIEHHFLEVKFQPGSLAKLEHESAKVLSIFNGIKHTLRFRLVFSAVTTRKKGLEAFSDFYRIDGVIPKEDLIPIATELETLDYVIYCSVTPDTKSMKAPELPALAAEGIEEQEQLTSTDTPTPDFTQLQTYVDAPRGMNIRSIWDERHGAGATVHHLDFGVYKNHEDLTNVQVITSRLETEDCNHGTASCGCVVGTDNSFGVKGIAHGCRFLFYDTGDLDLIVQNAELADIVALDIEFNDSIRGRLPVIDSKSWWDKIHALTQRHVTVLLAAANGAMNLSESAMNDWGDSGGTLVGACTPSTGRRRSTSNYNHYSLWLNSWGDSVTTTGYGHLQNRGINASYTSSYSGTSSATPLCAAALAIVQGYALSERREYYPPLVFREAAMYYGYDEGAVDGVGYRPNVARWLSDLEAKR
jgi:hypothetical protein